MAGTQRIVPDTAAFATIIARRLQKIYKENFSESLVNRILVMVSKLYPPRPHWSEKEVVLITYGDSIYEEGTHPLQSLRRFLNDQLGDMISSVHILPFFPSTSDDGFAVSDFYSVDPVLGDWNDIEAIGRDFLLMGDLVINHVSSGHPWFKRYLNNDPAVKDYFLLQEENIDYSSVVRPRSTPLFTGFNSVEGTKKVWTTFSADQVDLNFGNPEVLLEIIRLMVFYIARGIRLIRLDAIAYLWKCNGTRCLHLEETHEIVKLLRDVAEHVCPGTIILTETNVPNRENWSYFGNSDEAHMVYQFSLPPLLLHALYSGNSLYLTQWAHQIPSTDTTQTFLNYTASHDGIGVRPLEGLLPESEIAALIEGMTKFGGLVSMKTNADGTLSPYEINITYFEAMKGSSKGEDHLHFERFICSQAIMMGLKGIPAFYIHSLLATPNDHEGVIATGRARSINRRKLRYNGVKDQLYSDTMVKRVYEALKKMLIIRRNHRAFNPDSHMEVIDTGSKVFAFTRQSSAGEKVFCLSNVSGGEAEVNLSAYTIKKGYDLLSGFQLADTNRILMNACQTIWLVDLND